MDDKYKTMTYLESSKYTVDLIFNNPLLKIVIVPILLLSIVGAHFGVKVLEVINDIENYYANIIKKESPYKLMIRYMTTPFFHYVIILLNELIVTFFLSSVLRQSFCAFTNEYVLVNYEKFHSLGSGQIHAIIQRRLLAVEEFIRLLILNIFHDLFYIFIAFAKVQEKLGVKLFVANVVLFLIYLITIFYIIKMRVYFRLKYNDAYNIVSNKCYGILTNYDVIKSYTNEKHELETLDNKLNVLQDKNIVFECLTSLAEFAQKISLVIPNGYILYLGMSGLFFRELCDKEKYSLYNKLFLDVKGRISKLTQDTLKVTRFSTDISDSRIVEAKLDYEMRGMPIESFKKSIVFSNVDVFIKNQKICFNVNLSINKGEKIAIVGKNGSGKSTLFNVLLRLRSYNGFISIDDIDMNKLSKYKQRQIISYIPQNPGIQSGTILENLKYGRQNISDEKVMEICKDYGSHKIFSELPDGYNTECGEMGKYLSGGQKQIISFMRGVIKNGDIFIFDEHTSNLDSSGQVELVNYIFTLLKYKTCLAILHNLGDLHKFDKIIGICDGFVRVYERYDDYLADIHLY